VLIHAIVLVDFCLQSFAICSIVLVDFFLLLFKILALFSIFVKFDLCLQFCNIFNLVRLID